MRSLSPVRRAARCARNSTNARSPWARTRQPCAPSCQTRQPCPGRRVREEVAVAARDDAPEPAAIELSHRVRSGYQVVVVLGGELDIVSAEMAVSYRQGCDRSLSRAGGRGPDRADLLRCPGLGALL